MGGSPTLWRHPRESGDPVLRSLWGLLGPRFRGDDTRLFDSIRTKHALVRDLLRTPPYPPSEIGQARIRHQTCRIRQKPNSIGRGGISVTPTIAQTASRRR